MRSFRMGAARACETIGEGGTGSPWRPGSDSSRSVLQRAIHDLAHVRAQVRLRRDARDRLARRAAVRLGELAPAVERAREARGDLRVDRVEFGDALGPEHVALR